jgi:hypothetical protein
MKMKQIKTACWFASAVLIVALAFSVSAPAAPSGKAAPAPAPAAAVPAPPERHPEIREAIGALHRAKEHLEHARHDFGGHRVDAIRAVDDAIHQLEVCLRYDND